MWFMDVYGHPTSVYCKSKASLYNVCAVYEPLWKPRYDPHGMGLCTIHLLTLAHRLVDMLRIDRRYWGSRVVHNLLSGNLTQLSKITMFNEKTHYKWPCYAMFNSNVTLPEGIP